MAALDAYEAEISEKCEITYHLSVTLIHSIVCNLQVGQLSTQSCSISKDLREKVNPRKARFVNNPRITPPPQAI